jgi:hypothetical protein
MYEAPLKKAPTKKLFPEPEQFNVERQLYEDSKRK